MTSTPAESHYMNNQAGTLSAGSRMILPDATSSAEITDVSVEYDDFGAPALVHVTLTDGATLRIGVSSQVKVLAPGSAGLAAVTEGTPLRSPGEPDGGTPSPADNHPVTGTGAVVVPPLPPAAPAISGPTDDDLAAIPSPQGPPESVIEDVAARHQGADGVVLLTDKLAKGINTKSGSCLKDLSELAHELYIVRKDSEGALAVADLLNVLPFDGNPGRWTSVEATLALSAYICRQSGQDPRAEVYEKLLRAPDTQETDAFKARMQAKVRQRSLNEPNLYDKEIFRAIDNSHHDAEREWRLLRLESLLFLRAHGGSETIGGPELERRIANELEAVRS